MRQIPVDQPKLIPMPGADGGKPAPPPALPPALPRVWTPTVPVAQPGAADGQSPSGQSSSGQSPSGTARTAEARSSGRTTDAAAQPRYVNPGWAASVGHWLVQHHTGETDSRLRYIQGVVIISFTVLRDGQVQDVTVAQTSGYRALDEAAMALIRGARLPPFPPDMTQAFQDVTVPIRYGLE